MSFLRFGSIVFGAYGDTIDTICSKPAQEGAHLTNITQEPEAML